MSGLLDSGMLGVNVDDGLSVCAGVEDTIWLSSRDESTDGDGVMEGAGATVETGAIDEAGGVDEDGAGIPSLSFQFLESSPIVVVSSITPT
jgi:hypothetical protein